MTAISEKCNNDFSLTNENIGLIFKFVKLIIKFPILVSKRKEREERKRKNVRYVNYKFYCTKYIKYINFPFLQSKLAIDDTSDATVPREIISKN